MNSHLSSISNKCIVLIFAKLRKLCIQTHQIYLPIRKVSVSYSWEMRISKVNSIKYIKTECLLLLFFSFIILQLALRSAQQTASSRLLGKVQFIRSQKKNAQLVYEGYIFNKKLTQANGHTTWRCSDVSKNRCRAVCTTKNNELVHVRRSHEHEPHWGRIANRPLYNEEDDLDDILDTHKDDSLIDMSKLGPVPATMEYKYYIEDCS